MLLCWWVILIILVFLSRSPFTRLCLYCINCGRKRIIVTNSKKVDLALLLVMFLVLLIGTYFLKVYYRIIVTDIKVIHTLPDGSRKYLPSPTVFKKNWLAADYPDLVLENLENRIGRYTKSSGWYLSHLYKTPNAKIEWIIKYSHNSRKLERIKVIKFDENSQL